MAAYIRTLQDASCDERAPAYAGALFTFIEIKGGFYHDYE